MKGKLILAIILVFLFTFGTFAFGIENLYPKPLSDVSTNTKLVWTAKPGVYYVYIGNSKDDLTFIGSTTYFSFKPHLLPDKLYWWSVLRKSGNTYDYGPLSSFVTLPSSPVLVNPLNASINSTSIFLKWSGSGDFIVKLGLSSTNMTEIAETNKNQVLLPDLNPNTKYFWQVIKKGKYASARSKICFFYTLPVKTKLIYPRDGMKDIPTEAKFKWQAVPEETYDLYVGRSPNTMEKIFSRLPFSSIKVKLSPSTVYYWQVVSHSMSSQAQVSSNIAKFNTLFPLNVPSSPSPSSGAVGIPSNLLLSWKYQKGVKYNLYMGEKPNDLNLTAESVEVSAYKVNNLQKDKWYYWRVESILGKRHRLGPIWKFKTEKGSWHLIALNVQSFPFPYETDHTIELGRTFTKAIVLPSFGRIKIRVQVVEGPRDRLFLFLGNEENFMKAAAGMPDAKAIFSEDIGQGESVSYESPLLKPGTYYLYIQNSYIHREYTIFGNISDQYENPAQIDYSIEAWY